MTLSEMGQAQIYFYKRADWGPGEYVHCHAVYTNDDRGGAVGGAELCFCSAPMHGNDPRVEDDLWMRYEGPEVNAMLAIGGVRGAVLEKMLDSGMPLSIAMILSEMMVGRSEEREVAERVGVPPWQVGQEMHS